MNFKQLFFAIIFLVSVDVFSQNNKVFYDNFGVQGRVSYAGSWSDSSLPQRGKYELKWRSFSDTNLYTYNTIGTLVDGMPNGKWVWEEASWNYTVEPGRNIEPVFSANGQRYVWQANFAKGKAEGSWSFTVDSLPQTNVNKKRNLIIQANFKQGILVGKFKIEDNRFGNNFSAIGECDTKGAANGNWVIKSTQDSVEKVEIRSYDKGVLLSVLHLSINKTDTTASAMKMTSNIECMERINLGDSTLHFKIGEKEFESDMNESQAQASLMDYLNNYFLCGWKLPVFYANIQRKGPVYKRIEFPISQNEDSLIVLTKNKIKGLLDNIFKRQNYPSLYINRGRTLELDLAIGYMELSYSKLLIADSLLAIENRPLFTFKNRYIGEGVTWNTILNKDSLFSAEFFENNRSLYPLFINEPSKYGLFESVKNYIEVIENELNTHFVEIDKSFALLQREGELLEIENKLSESLKQLESNYENTQGIGIDVFEKWVHGYIKNSFQEYSKETDYNQLKVKAKVIQSKMDTLLIWLKDWQRIDSMQKNLKESYTIFEYNPYTGKRDIEIRKKRRFYNKIEVSFWPWMVDMLKNAQNWDDFVEQKQKIEIAYSYLSNFASLEGKSSRRIEKRIRKEKSNERILRIILSHM